MHELHLKNTKGERASNSDLTMMPPLDLKQCRHVDNIPLIHTLLYCLSLSTFFVAALYIFVPTTIKQLPRDDVQHIKWRSTIILIVMIIGIGVYPLLFCQSISVGDEIIYPQWYRYLGFTWQPIQDVKIAIHVLRLYLGSFTCSCLKVYNHSRILHWEKEIRNKGQSIPRHLPPTQQLPIIIKLQYLLQSFQYIWIQPTKHSFKSFLDDVEYRWIILRNLCIAPLVEEVIFRACLLPPLLVSITTKRNNRLTPTQSSWIAPLFFGIAHLHHFYEKYRQIPSRDRSNKVIGQLVLVVAVQWTYTTLFGAYVSHIFIRTCSLLGITLAHILCNYMGLPNVSFTHPTSNLYGYFWFILIMYSVGIFGFVIGFDSVLFPKESVLVSLLNVN